MSRHPLTRIVGARASRCAPRTRVGFIVTTLTGTNRAVVRFYNHRGTAEQWIKEGKTAAKAASARTTTVCPRARHRSMMGRRPLSHPTQRMTLDLDSSEG